LVVQSFSTPKDVEDGHERLKRADARRNRLQILEAAEISFAEHGIGVPIDDIARRAGVGVGTVYRHFPTKEALAGAVIITRMEHLATEAEDLEKSDDPGGAFFTFLARLADEGTAKRDLIEALTGAGVDFKAISGDVRPRLEESSGKLLVMAQKAGKVRPDVEMSEIFGLVMGACEVANKETKCSRSRMMSIVFDGLRVPENDGDPRKV
jgi:AcrR family transcriptional regulator